MVEGTNSEKRLEIWRQMLEYLMFLFLVLLLMQDECNLHVNFEVLLNVNHTILYLIWCCGKWSYNFGIYILGCNDYSNKRIKIRPNLVAHSELGPSTCGLCCWCHLPHHVWLPRHCPHHCHVSSHVIIAIHVIVKSTATSFFMSPLCDMAIKSVTKLILLVTLIFVIENGLGLGFGGPGTFHDSFKTSWIKQFMTKI